MEARILLTGAELDLFTLLARGPISAGEVTAAIQGNLRGVTILLDALAAMGLVEKKGDRYTCPPPVAALLSKDSPTAVLPMVLHAVGLWQRWSRLTKIVRQGAANAKPASFGDAAQMRAFIGAMHVVGARMGRDVVAAINPGSARDLLDVGGASGTYTQAFLEMCPGMRATVFDLPPVIELARERLGQAGLLDRVTLVGGDFYRDELPGGHDLALLSAIIHQNSPEQNRDLYRKIARALAPGGRLVIRDHVMSPDRTQPAAGALFAVNMLVATQGGGTYTLDEIRDALEKAGFERVRLLQADAHMSALVEAYKPE
jgi:SAM-dependent methyltransferase